MAQPERNMAETTPEGATTTLERSAEQATDQASGTPNQEIAPGGAREFLDRVLRGSGLGPEQGGPAVPDNSGGGGGGTPPEGPREPEPTFGPEWEASPERGRVVANEIIRLETTLPYDERYKVKTGLLSISNPEIYHEGNGSYLDQLYIDLQAYVVTLCKTRNEKDPWDPQKIYQEIVEAMKAEAAGSPPREESENERKQREADEIYLNSKTADEHKAEIAKMKKISESDEVTPEQQEEIEEKLLIYFRAAKRKDLLRSADLILESVYQEHIIGAPREKPSDEEMPPPVQTSLLEKVKLVNEAAAEAKTVSGDIYRMLRVNSEFVRENPEIAWLKDIWDPYIARAKQRIERYMYDFDQPDYQEGEFQAEADRRTVGRTGRETYWRPSSWASYYTVSARNPEQFRTAVDTFLQMIRTGSIGKSPDDIYPHLQNFKNALGAAGGVQEQAGRIKHELLEELRQEFEGVSYAFGADYNNEDYNPDGYYKYMMAMTKDEGPERWIRLARSRGAQVAYDLKWFDRVTKEAVSTLLHNACGSRGQIGNDTITQHFLQDQIKEIQIERSMGVMIEDYDPEDTNPNSPVKLSNSRAAEAKRAEYKRKNIERIGLHMPDEEFKALYDGFDNGDAHINNYLRFASYDQSKFPDSLKKSIELGRIQLAVSKLDLKTVARLKKGEKIAELSERDRIIYKEAYDQAKTSFDIAFQMVGISCEKVRRGGGIFYVDRNVHIQDYQAWQNIDDGKLSDVQRRSKRIGRILMELRDRQNLPESDRLTTLKSDDQVFYRTLSEEDKLDYVDHLPLFLAEKFVQYAVARAKIQFANASAKDRAAAVQKVEDYAVQQIKQHGLSAKLIVVPVLKFDAKGNVVGIDGDRVETIDLPTAAESIYSRWTSHTYWGYQNENRHYLLAPHIFEQARQIRAGLLDPEKADLLAIQLLIIDPTLKRVAKLAGDQEQREITLLQNAVNESFQGHWRINRKLYKAFLPKDGNPDKMRAGFNFEDWGGQSRFVIRIKELIASQPNRFARRLAAMIADIPMEISSMPDIWGQEGVLGAIEMFADPIADIAHQKVVSKLGITKYVNQMRYGWLLYGAFVGYTDEEKGINFEGLFEKPTNNSDKLAALYRTMYNVKKYQEAENVFFYEIMKTFDRLDKVLKLMRVMSSDVRNAQGALLLEPKDIFMPDGSFNPEIAFDKNTGTSRHSQRVFFDTFVDWLQDDGPGGGARVYPLETRFYRSLENQYFYFNDKGKRVEPKNPDGSPRTWRDWLFDKMCR